MMNQTHYPVHYHISARTERDGTHVEIVEQYDLSREKFEKTVQLLKDLSGGQTCNSDFYSALFENGDLVKWRHCYKSCLAE